MSKSFFFVGFTKPSEDGHKRITKFTHGVAMGGTQEEHEKMQDHLMKVDKRASKVISKCGDKITREHIREIISDD